MKKDYELLNEVKVDFNKYENIELDDLEKQKIKNRLKGQIKAKKKSNKKIIVAAAVFVIVGSITINTTVVQATREYLGNKLEQFFGVSNNKSYDEYKKVIGSSIEDKGITFTLNEFLIKEGRATINVKVDTRKFKKGIAVTIFPEIYIDDIKVSGGGSTNFNYNEDGTYEMLNQVKLEDIDINKDIKIDIKYLGGEYKKYGIERGINGNWTFSINDNGEIITQKTKNIEINKTIDFGDGYIYDINNIIVSPIDVLLKYNTKLMDEEKIIKGDDKARDILFEVMDVNKNILTMENGMSISGNMISGDMEAFMFLDKKVENKVLIVPYKRSDKSNESTDESIKNRQYIWEKAIEVDLQ